MTIALYSHYGRRISLSVFTGKGGDEEVGPETEARGQLLTVLTGGPSRESFKRF